MGGTGFRQSGVVPADYSTPTNFRGAGKSIKRRGFHRRSKRSHPPSLWKEGFALYTHTFSY